MTTTVRDLPELLRPAIEKYRDEAEALGRLPGDLVQDLIAHSAFRLYTPRELGGFEASPAEVLEVLTGIARIDGPTAWILWNLNMGWAAGLFAPDEVARIWAPGNEPLIANSGQPGRLTGAADGMTLSGRWKIVSGAHLATWFLLAGVTGDEPAGFGAGLYFCLVPREDVTVLDTWDVAGMRASDSNSVEADVFVPRGRIFAISDPNRLTGAAYRLPTINLVYPGCAAVLIGMAQAAVDEVVALARTKSGLAQNETVQTAVGRATAQVAAARGLLLSTAAELDRTTGSGAATTEAQRAAVRGAMCLITETARTVLTAMYAAGSSDPLYVSNRLGRIFRDGMAAAQAANLSTAQWSLAGRLVLGEPAGAPFV